LAPAHGKILLQWSLLVRESAAKNEAGILRKSRNRGNAERRVRRAATEPRADPVSRTAPIFFVDARNLGRRRAIRPKYANSEIEARETE
jgi:hypothetical protein